MPGLRPKQIEVDELAAAIMERIDAVPDLKKAFWNLSNGVHSVVTTPSSAGLVKDITFSSITGSGFTVSWSAISGATSYQLQYWVKGDMLTLETVVGIVGTSYAVTGLTAGTQYEVQVKANV